MIILAVPTWLKNCIGNFSLSYQHGKLPARYVTDLIASGNKTRAGISSVFMKHSRATNRLVTEYP
ncbi:MAG: hypothetical protein QXU32_13000 [Nitrososphaerales archaeon]